MTDKPKFPDLDACVYRIVSGHAGVFGLSVTHVFGFMPSRAGISNRHLVRSLIRLARAGKIERHEAPNGTTRWTMPGAAFVVSEQVDDSSPIETVEMAAALENLFAICPHRYGDGDIISLERGRVGLKPSIPVAGRAIGGW